MPERMIRAEWWHHHERSLAYAGHAKAARDAADNPYTPPSLRRTLLEREARFVLRAQEEERQMKEAG